VGFASSAKLADLTRQDILNDISDAAGGKKVDEWETYLRTKLAARGLKPRRYQVGEKHPLPCAHLVVAGRPHWVYQAENGGVHDPSDVAWHVPPRMLCVEDCGTRILTIALDLL
jgi:hypothetical protein